MTSRHPSGLGLVGVIALAALAVGTGACGGGTAGPGGSGGAAGSGGRGGAAGAAGVGGAGTGGAGTGGAGTGGADAAEGGSGGRTDAGIAEAHDSSDARAFGPDAAADVAGEGGLTQAVIAATPPMGWNSWNTFQCNLDETLIKGVADTIVSTGMQAAGYQYVNLDDCWMNGRDQNGNLLWNAQKFPAGIPALAAYVHGKGLKLGIYESANTDTCVGIYRGISPTIAVGSLGHEAQDAQTFASWNVDFLKHDLCAGDRASFAKMRDGLRAAGRPIVYSINPGNGANDLYPPTTPGWNVVAIANMWRIAFDINASWASVTSIIDQDAPFSTYAGPGHWNDADMLEVGKGMTASEDRAHFSMWAMLASPLLAGNDIRSMTAATRDTLTNAEVIAVDQDALGIQGRLVATPATNVQIWSKALAGSNTRAVALFNRTAANASITVRWTDLALPAGNATVRDLWAHADLGTFNGSYTAATVATHSVVMLKITSAP